MKKNVILSVFLWLTLFCTITFAEDSIPAPVVPVPVTEPVAHDSVATQPEPVAAAAVQEEPTYSEPAYEPDYEETYTSSNEISLKMGIRLGLGASGFRNHVKPEIYSNRFVELKPAFALSTGLTMQIGITKAFSIAPELLYSLYRSNNEEVKENNTDFNTNLKNNLYDVGVYMHALELPVLARVSVSSIYLEVGPQVGVNLYSKVYVNADYYRPDMNRPAFGVAAGLGLDMISSMLGVRGYYGITEYSKDAKGTPWNVQLNISFHLF